MKGHTSKERLRRKKELASEYRMSGWLTPTDAHKNWLADEVRRSKQPGYSLRHIIKDSKTGKIALARKG
jgi:hypothetical protein